MLCNCKEEKKVQRIGILRSGNFHNPFQIAHIKIKDHFVSVFPQLVGYGKEISPQLLYVTSLTFALFSVPVIKCNILKSQSSEKKHKSSSHSCCLTPKTHAVFFFKHLPSNGPSGLALGNTCISSFRSNNAVSTFQLQK